MRYHSLHTMEALDAIRRLHAEIDRAVAPLEGMHRDRLECRKGCIDCCRDDITVFEIEAERLRSEHAALLRDGDPHPPGRCAFLDAEGACRVYESRPYVCRTQGLPLRWLEEDQGTMVEYRDICTLNESGPLITDLQPNACWTIGPTETKLQALERARCGGDPRRVKLRELFAQPR